MLKSQVAPSRVETMSYFLEVGLDSSFQPFAAFREQFGLVPKVLRAQSRLSRWIEAITSHPERTKYLVSRVREKARDSALLIVGFRTRSV
jgi:hypothetical protein